MATASAAIGTDSSPISPNRLARCPANASSRSAWRSAIASRLSGSMRCGGTATSAGSPSSGFQYGNRIPLMWVTSSVSM